MKSKLYLISKIQEQFWILHKLFPDNTAYNIPLIFKVEGEIDLQALEDSVNIIISRHEVLRACFVKEDGKIYQKVRATKEVDYKVEVVRLGKSYNDDVGRDQISNELHKAFELSIWPLFRMKLFTFENRVSVLTIVFHHIIVDLRSRQIFEKELSDYYSALTRGSEPGNIAISGNYSDYTNWLNTWLTSDEAKKKMEAWKNEIPETGEILEVAADFPRPKVNNLEGKSKYFTIDSITSSQVNDMARENIVDSFTILLAAYSIFLNRLSKKSRIVIGVPLTNRRKAEFSGTFGCFVNIVPIFVEFREGMTGKDIIKQVRQALLRAHRNQEVPFLVINELLSKVNRDSIFKVGYTFQPPMRISLGELNVQTQNIEKNGSQLDLFLFLWEEGDLFKGYLEYSTSLYKESTAQKFVQIYKQVVTSLLQNSDIPTSVLEIISEEEAKFISEWNNTEKEYEDDVCIHKKFELTVKENSEAIALLEDHYSLSYSQLNAEANRLAHYLIKSGIGVEDKVAICLNRSVEMIISIFAILKAGAAYLPVNPTDPAERITRILRDADPKLIITNSIASSNLPNVGKAVELDHLFQELQMQSITNPEVKVISKNLAYVIYTSGSTGMPKGVMVEHHSVINRLEWMQSAYPINQFDTILQKTPITFDVSVWEFFWWCFNGARLAILPIGGERDPIVIARYIKKYQVTTMHFIPSMFSAFLGTMIRRDNVGELLSLKRLFLSGEALPSKLVKDFNELRTSFLLPDVINLYGPTEATVDVSYYNCPADEVENIYIGKPIDNTGLFVVNENYIIQPIGIPGELIITGVNLARGYLNNETLTREKFRTFNFIGAKGIRGYCTGDIVRLTESGEIEFIGRKDFQVKIRGFRIELGEIESALMEHSMVENCAVVLWDNQEEKAVNAYISCKAGNEPKSNVFRNFLKERLPDYMVPANYFFLETLPLNSNGKIDKAKLAGLSKKKPKEIILPKSVCERSLLEIWKETLKKEDISINDNFFDVGGNSILAISLISIINDCFNVEVDITGIFEYPTVRALSSYLSSLTIETDFEEM